MRRMLLVTSGLVLVAGGVRAQVMTDLIVADRPTLVIEQGRFDAAFDEARRLLGASNPAGEVSSVIDEVIDDAVFGATEVIDETLGLEGVPQLRFDTPGNKAGVEQGGVRNSADIDQPGGAAWAVVNQLGEENDANIVQQDGARSGQPSLNRAYVGQVGAGTPVEGQTWSQTVNIDQGHFASNGDVSPNRSVVLQGGIRGVAWEDPRITRQAVGVDNITQITQRGAGNDILVQQGAENATAFRAQFGDTVGRNNTAFSRQEGNGNVGMISQEDDSDAKIMQFGADNRAFVQQDNDVDGGGMFSIIEQGGVIDGDRNFATNQQRAIEQKSTIVQLSNDNVAVVQQDGRANYAESTIRQEGGDGNIALVTQSADSPFASDGLFSAILQDGSLNTAIVRQTRNKGSSSTITQTGNNNLAEVSQ